MHTCTRATCLRYNKHGQLTCKRRAPWELSTDSTIDHLGRYRIKRTMAFMNNFNPSISGTFCCNNDIKLISNGADTKDVMWYTTGYQSKKQGKNYNVSALMAKTLLYHETRIDADRRDNILDQNRLLVFRCQHAINREMEMSAPQVISYLMRWGDRICSNHYVLFYWSSIQGYLQAGFDELKSGRNSEAYRSIGNDNMDMSETEHNGTREVDKDESEVNND
ncbi:hypothetical protein L210DRAFT_3616285 [Boletus edulis BED1]|uniref:Uncharacterized protein n=1 Tax=Boletus edulis BED1 TaxID=1328754 RepID=A0AAD4BB65_BOLED|nr:hypothetical protein L210DRAFT_3616285 [Boletus edulis BED1]